MTDYTELELKTFDISGRDSNLSLSVTSLALVSDLPSPQQSSEELCRLIQSKQLWLVSPGVCRIQIIVRQNKLPDGIEVGFLEHLANAICQCSLWASLGLTIKQEDIQYQPLYEGAPNLYFIVEHPQKSSVLLSPTHSPTARFNGIECIFSYNSETPEISQVDMEQADTHNTNMDAYSHGATSELKALDWNNFYEDDRPADYWDDPMPNMPVNQAQQRWDDAGYLAQVALHVIIGTRERVRGLRVFHLDTRPSLLQLTPTIWNAHYLKAVTFHVANFPVISSILAMTSRSKSPTLRRKSIKLLVGDAYNDDSQEGSGTEIDINIYRDSIHQRLWDLVQIKLKPAIYMKKPNRGFHSQWSETTNETFESTPIKSEDLDEYEDGVLINMGNNDVDFSGAANDGWPFYGFQEYEIQDGVEFDDAAGYQQWWDENEGMEFADEDLPMEDIDVIEQDEIVYPPDFSLHASFPNWYTSNTENLDETPTDGQYTSGDFGDPAMNVDDLQEPDYLYDADTIYNAINVVQLGPETEIWVEL
ncbi:hypothetical protein F4776DRAFT_665057 [Hypoxylon sp. NC0597]|nr:hypothetical protein F4776DRAFT_665057 [Hypoxylon sp. NC0597]